MLASARETMSSAMIFPLISGVIVRLVDAVQRAAVLAAGREANGGGTLQLWVRDTRNPPRLELAARQKE